MPTKHQHPDFIQPRNPSSSSPSKHELTLFNLGVFNNSVPLMFVFMGTKFFVLELAIRRDATAGSCSYRGPARERTEV